MSNESISTFEPLAQYYPNTWDQIRVIREIAGGDDSERIRRSIEVAQLLGAKDQEAPEILFKEFGVANLGRYWGAESLLSGTIKNKGTLPNLISIAGYFDHPISDPGVGFEEGIQSEISTLRNYLLYGPGIIPNTLITECGGLNGFMDIFKKSADARIKQAYLINAHGNSDAICLGNHPRTGKANADSGEIKRSDFESLGAATLGLRPDSFIILSSCKTGKKGQKGSIAKELSRVAGCWVYASEERVTHFDIDMSSSSDPRYDLMPNLMFSSTNRMETAVRGKDPSKTHIYACGEEL